MGDARPGYTLALARDLLRAPKPDPAHALDAAWRNFVSVRTGPAQIPALLLMAQALQMLDRPAQQQRALAAAVERAPNDPLYRQMLADARRAAGLLVARVRTETTADPPRACIAFTVPPQRGSGFHPADWVQLDPPAPQEAVTREGDQICVSGLPLGMTTQIVLRQGMPGEDGLALNRRTVVNAVMANRPPLLALDGAAYILPLGQVPRLSLGSVNVTRVKLTLVRLAERAVQPWVAGHPLTDPSSIDPGELASSGRTVWTGSAEIPHRVGNVMVHTALPVPDAFADVGLYGLAVEADDGAPVSAQAVQMILRTDLAPTIWRGADGLTVQVRGYGDARPRPGVRLDLIATDNDILAGAVTDADGVARFAAPLLRGDGPLAPTAIHAAAGQDFATLSLTGSAFDLSDRGVAGQADPGPLDAWLWLDRGIFRPGETVNVMALLRDHAGAPVDLPAHVVVRKPNGQVFLDTVPPRGPDESLRLALALTRSAPTGSWTVDVLADPKQPPIGSASFRVAAFVPDRMAVDLGPEPPMIVPGRPALLPLAARYLYGAPATGLTGQARLQLQVADPPFPALVGYRVGLVDEIFAPDAMPLDVPQTDAEGHAAIPIVLDPAPDSTHPVSATVSVTVNDPGGHGVTATATIPVQAAAPMIGIRPAFQDSVDADAEAGFDIAAVDPQGARIALPVRLRLVRERPDWRLVMTGQTAHYQTVWQDEPLETRDLTLPAAAPLHYAKRVGFGRYRLEVLQQGGLAATSVRFRAGWVASESPDVPDKVDVSSGRHVYPAGAVAHIHVAPPFGGPATLLTLGERIDTLRNIDVPAGGTDVDVPVDAAWGAGAYVAVHVFHPGTPTARPTRAIGLVWIGVDPGARRLPVSFDAADRYLPRGRATLGVKTAPGATVTLAAVDEGILRLTDFPSPDPLTHFFGQRLLGLDIHDDWGRLIRPGEGEATVLREGGGEGGEGAVLPVIPQVILSLFTPPVQAGPDGVAHVTLDLPDFNGQVRLMAVSWSGKRVGAASRDVFVRDPLVAEPLLPRFLAPGDEARLALLLHNVELPDGAATVDMSVSGPLAITGPTHFAATLAHGAQALAYSTLRGTAVGQGTLALDVTGPQGVHFRRTASLLVRPARTDATSVAATQLAPGAEARIVPPGGFIDGSWQAQASFGGAVRYDATALVRALQTYPFGCLEQSTSRGFPLAFLPDGPVAGDDRPGRLQSAVEDVLDRQRYDGGFGLWSASGEAEPWLSAYATEFLIRARAAGATVPDPALSDAEKFLADAAADGFGDHPAERAAQAYRLYVLALAGQARVGAERVMFVTLDSLPTPLAKAQLGAALALSNDAPRAEQAFAAALAAPARKDWGADYGSALRDQAATTVLLKESGLLTGDLPKLVAGLPGADLQPDTLNTQEQAWTAAAAAVLGRNGAPTQLAVDGHPLAAAPIVSVPLTDPIVARNLGDRAVWQTVSATGVPSAAPPASGSQMRVSRQFLTQDGSALDLDHLTQNTVFVEVLDGRAEDGQRHTALLLQGLPAGWEIVGRFQSGTVPGMSWLGTLSDTTAQPSLDDRYAAVMALRPDAPAFHLAVTLRAVTPGNYELPGADVSDMYRPAIHARQGANRIIVLPP